MNLAVYQGPVVYGDREANVRAVVAALAEADRRGAAILGMPETFLDGYFPVEADARAAAVDLDGPEFAALLERFAPFRATLLLGLNERRGDALYNTVAVIERGRLVGRYAKNYLVYRYFERGHEFPVFQRDGVVYGVLICADTSYTEPARILAMKGARVLFTPHFNYIGYEQVDEHTRRVRAHHRAIAIDNDVVVARANVVVPESQGAAIFGHAGVGVGDSFVLDRTGRPLAEAGLHRADLLVVALDAEALRRPRDPWRRTTPEIARALAEQYDLMFARHENDD